MPLERLSRFVTLPELEILKISETRTGGIFEVRKTSEFEVCPNCAMKAFGIYDHRWTKVKDEPIRGREIVLRIRKRSFWCRPCKKPFTEPVAGIGKGHRTTKRYRKALKWACDTFESLKKARRYMRCSTSTLYRLY